MADEDKQEIKRPTESGNQRSTFDRDWTKGSILLNLLSLSWPMIVSDSFNLLGPTIDMIWVGKLGVASIAGVGVAGMGLMIVTLGRMGINTGMRAMIARFIGAGDNEGANHVAQQALVVNAAYTVIFATIGILFSEQILKLFGVEADVVVEGSAYLRIMFAGTAATSFHMLAEGVMQAAGDTMTPMKISATSRVTHTALCPFLVFGWWVFPRLGVTGAAMASVITQSLAMALGLWIVFTGRSRLRLTLRNFHFDPNVIWRIVRIGIPASIMMVQRSVGGLVLMLFIIPFGTIPVAAHTVLRRLTMFVSMPSLAFGRCAGVLVGQNLGAQQPGRAGRSAWLAVSFSESLMIIFSVVMLLWPGSVIRIFSSDPDLVKIASVFLRIAVVGYLATGFDYVLQMSLSGAGDTLPPMLVSLLRTWVVTVPLAYFLPQVANLGVYGVRWAMAIGIVIGTIVYIIYFQVGRWKRKKV